MATRLPLGLVATGVSQRPQARSRSATKRSSRPICTARSTPPRDLPRVQPAWHCFSCGQTRPQMEGRRLVRLMTAAAPEKSPSATLVTKPGMSTPTGQPATQGLVLQLRQRAASRRACDSV